MVDQLPTAYERLGVSPQASASEITSAYRRLLRRHHPDSRDVSQLGREDLAAGEDAAEALGPIIEAYAVLRDPGRRADYDRQQEALNRKIATYRGGVAHHDLLLRAGPVRWQEEPTSSVRWQEEPTSSRGSRRLTITDHEAMEQLLEVLRGRWFYW